MPIGVATELTDEQIVRRVVGGERQLFEILASRYAGRIYNLALRMVHQPADAEDAMQEAFLLIFSKLDSFREESRFSTWLYKVALNAIYGRLRKREQAVEPGLDQRVAPDDPEGEAFRNEALAQLRLAIARLPLDQRIVLVARDIEELTAEETAHALGLTLATVKTRLHRARFTLRSALENSLNPFAAGPHHKKRRSEMDQTEVTQ